MEKKVLVLTGIRSEYDLIKPVLELLNKDKSINLSIESMKIIQPEKSQWTIFYGY